MITRNIQINNIMENHNSNWPIHPQWLSIQEGILESEVKPNSQGIFKPDTLRGFIAEASDDKRIKNTLSIFQVVPQEYNYENSNDRIEKVSTKDKYIRNILNGRNIIRIDPGQLYQNIKCCACFRECTDINGDICKNKCFDLDSRIALLYHSKLASINFLNEYEKYMKVFEEIVNEYNESIQRENSEYKDYPVEILPYCENTKANRSLFVKYRCKFSNLDEYFFPIFHSGKIIAVLMQGQRPHSTLTKANMFIDYRNDSDTGKKLDNSIKNLEDDYFHQDPLNSERQEAIFTRINDLSVRINDCVKSISQQYVSEEFSKIENSYREKLQRKSQSKNAFSNSLSTLINEALTNVLRTFNKEGFIRIYTRKSEIETIDTSIIEFSMIGNTSIGELEEYPLLEFSSDLPSFDINDENHLKKFLLSNIPIEEGNVFRLKMQFGSKIGYIVWKKYNNWKNDYPIQYKLYARSLMALYPSLLEPYFIWKSLSLEENLERTMRFTVHESAQIIPSVIESINNEDSKWVITENISIKQTFNVTIPSYKIIDATQRLILLERLFRTSTMIFKKENLKCEWNDIYRMVYATDSLFSKKAREENYQYLNIDFEPKLKHYDLFTDYGFMSHIFFNLVDNAIKYGFRGSNINIKVTSLIDELFWSSKEKRIKEVQFSIISFGNEIKEKDRNRIFDLYYRSEESNAIEGMGMGLFLVQKLCNAMGYDVKCQKSVLMEKINLPYYYHYKIKHPHSENIILNERIIKLLNSDIENSKIDIAVNKKVGRWRIPTLELEKNLNSPTFKNEFTITIPVNSETLKESEI